MGTVGDAYGNAMAASFFVRLACEWIIWRTWNTKSKASLAVFTWIESWCNPRRRHSGLNDQSANNFERQDQEGAHNTEPDNHWRVYGVLCKRGCDQSLGILPSN